jgi:hypothetical protein
MQSGWQLVYLSDQMHLIEIVKAILSENNIESFAVDRKDSTYITIGAIELYVKDMDVMRSKYLIDHHQL